MRNLCFVRSSPLSTFEPILPGLRASWVLKCRIALGPLSFNKVVPPCTASSSSSFDHRRASQRCPLIILIWVLSRQRFG